MNAVIRLIKIFLVCLFCIAIADKAAAQDLGNLSGKKPVNLRGNLNLQLELYRASGIDPRKKDFSWLITGNPVLDIYGVQIPFSFLFSNFENRFYQPFNQFGISPYYKWIKLHLGYRNLNWSPYSLAGHRMLGAGVELTPKNFRIGFMYGLLRRSASIDSTMNANPFMIRPAPTFKRTGYAARIGYGNANNYIDLVYFHAADKENSLNAKEKDSIQPAENTSIGISFKVKLAKNLSLKTDAGFSAYTINKNDEEDSTGIGKLSTRKYFAGESRISYRLPTWGAEVLYKRIEPDYKSMGAYFFQSDLQEYSFHTYFKLDSGRLNISGNAGFQQDNLKKQKSSTSKRFIGSANISYIPSAKFGLVFNYSNFGITQNPLQTTPTSLLFKQVNNSLMLMPFFSWMNPVAIKNLQVVAMYQLLSTPESSLGAQPDLNTLSLTTSYSHTWIKKGYNANGSLNYILSKTPGGDLGSYGGSVGAMIPLVNRKITVNTQASYLKNTFNKGPNGYTIRGTIGFTVPVGTHHNIQLLGNYLKNQADNTGITQNFDELSLQLIYGLSF